MFKKSPHSNEYLAELRHGCAVAEASLAWNETIHAYRLTVRAYWDDPQLSKADPDACGRVHTALFDAVRSYLPTSSQWVRVGADDWLWQLLSGRYEVVRDDGDSGVGLGYSYRYYECVDGVWSSVNQEFTRCYERITPESSIYYHQDIAAILREGDQGKALMSAKRLPDPAPGFIPDNGFTVFARGYDGFMHEDRRLYPKKPRQPLW